ncbi:hypothetical protein SsS58_06972 [Streptomyces scabiei]|uniref:Uncharacterized protein n=1 Tax=Streptomyces scabiei TaxID=1930 RepID=A0A100JVN1_STRSC|nr:hypothetical protein SsS58_06972 [Streptomyces scabiei]
MTSRSSVADGGAAANHLPIRRTSGPAPAGLQLLCRSMERRHTGRLDLLHRYVPQGHADGGESDTTP